MKKNILKLSWILIASLLVFSACDKDDDDPAPTVIEDGIYVKGAATALTDFDIKGLFKATKNEVINADRADLLEIYVAVKAGAEGFQIANVVGGTPKYWGPGADFAEVTAGTIDEPKVAFWRGSYTETETVFTVPTDGLYHIAIDLEVGKVVVVPVEYWGIIGGATAIGWSGDTKMESTGFDLNTMTFQVTDMELSNAEFKFRYSGGWKVEIDTTYDNGGSNDPGIKVNTNFGGAVDALVPGGANIANTVPGVYTATLTWTLGTGYVAALTKTGDVAKTDWTGVVLDAVGIGVSADNTTAIPDPSSWGWGNKLLADNAGVPIISGDLYVWTWSGIWLEAGAGNGFKLRTENGVAPATNGANFDAGYDAVNLTASTTHVWDGGDGNLYVDAKAQYNITITIDAATGDTKEIIITE